MVYDYIIYTDLFNLHISHTGLHWTVSLIFPSLFSSPCFNLLLQLLHFFLAQLAKRHLNLQYGSTLNIEKRTKHSK